MLIQNFKFHYGNTLVALLVKNKHKKNKKPSREIDVYITYFVIGQTDIFYLFLLLLHSDEGIFLDRCIFGIFDHLKILGRFIF